MSTVKKLSWILSFAALGAAGPAYAFPAWWECLAGLVGGGASGDSVLVDPSSPGSIRRFESVFGIKYLRHNRATAAARLDLKANTPFSLSVLESWVQSYIRQSGGLTEAKIRAAKELSGPRLLQVLDEAMVLTYSADIKRGKVIPILVRKVNDKIGYGAFANHTIRSGEFVGEYTGDLLSHVPPASDTTYLFHLVDDMSIDALKAGNALRFINHADKPNLGVQVLYVHGEPHIIFFAVKKIEPGEQLFINYGKDYWAPREEPKDISP